MTARLYLRRLPALSLILLLGTGSPDLEAQALTAPGAAEQVRAANQRLQDAVMAGDTAAFEQLLAPDYLFITATGEVNRRDDVLRIYAAGELAHTIYRADSVRVRLFGNAAVVTAVLIKESRYVRGRRAGTNVSGRYRSTRVYVRRGDHWQVVSTHESRIGP
ncbi:MAG: nuclear transport factor 2 family protein [Gemmatimonadetes bacterium]|nr:nuclear transport factor 2 family protein [Gemmatimonadota bacterium]